MIQQQKPKPRPRHRRTVGELVAAWLLLLWGAGTAIFFSQLGYEPNLTGTISHLLWVLQGTFCGLAGLLALLSLRSATRASLFLGATCLLCLIGFGLWLAIKSPQTAVLNLTLSGALLLIALGYFFLGRWLGQQEDSEE